MRFTATLTYPEGGREEKLFDVPDRDKPKEMRIEAFILIAKSLFGTDVFARGQVDITTKSDPKFRRELL